MYVEHCHQGPLFILAKCPDISLYTKKNLLTHAQPAHDHTQEGNVFGQMQTESKEPRYMESTIKWKIDLPSCLYRCFSSKKAWVFAIAKSVFRSIAVTW